MRLLGPRRCLSTGKMVKSPEWPGGSASRYWLVSVLRPRVPMRPSAARRSSTAAIHRPTGYSMKPNRRRLVWVARYSRPNGLPRAHPVLGDGLGSDPCTTRPRAKVVSRWRTAPLWGMGYRLKLESHSTFLHDGRARSAEEAILWHSGEAAREKRNFMNLGPRAREALLHWLETL